MTNPPERVPLVSIGMPVYNDRPFLAEAVDSLLAQTFADFELILRDDCSTDGSAEICLEYCKRDPRVRYIRNEVNLGISRTMQRLLKDGCGSYFMWAGDDDVWRPTFIAQLLDALQGNPDCVVAFCPYVFIDEVGATIGSARVIDYSGASARVRVLKLARYWDDGFGYGLFRSASIQGVRFPVWWWVNRQRAYNNIYPALYFCLARGNFRLVGPEPLWLNRLKARPHHKVPFQGRLLARLAAAALWKVNVMVASAAAIFRGSRSPLLLLSSVPALAYRMARDCRTEAICAIGEFRAGSIRL